MIGNFNSIDEKQLSLYEIIKNIKNNLKDV